MLTGEFPYKEKHTFKLLKSIMENPLDLRKTELSPDAQTLLKGLLTKDPKLRLTIDQVILHPFFSKLHRKKRLSISQVSLNEMVKQLV